MFLILFLSAPFGDNCQIVGKVGNYPEPQRGERNFGKGVGRRERGE